MECRLGYPCLESDSNIEQALISKFFQPNSEQRLSVFGNPFGPEQGDLEVSETDRGQQFVSWSETFNHVGN